MAFSRYAKNEAFEYNDQKLNYITTRDKNDYDLACRLLQKASDEKSRREIIRGFMPASNDVLDYGDRDFKVFIDACRELKIDMPFTVYGLKERAVDEEKQCSLANLAVQTLCKQLKTQDFRQAEKFIISDWLAIEPFLIQIRRMRKGEQHKLCKDVALVLKDNWDSTYFHNPEEQYRRLVNLYKHLNITTNFSFKTKTKYRKTWLAQMYDNKPKMHTQMFETLTRIPETINKIQDGVVALSGSMEHISGCIDKFAYICDYVLDKVDNTFRNLPILIMVVKALAFAYLLQTDANRTIKNLTALIMLILPSDVTSNLINISGLTRAVQGIMQRYSRRMMTQMNDEDDASIIGSFISMAKFCVTGMFSDIDKSKFNSMTIKVNKVRIVAEFLKSATTLTDYFGRLMEKVLELMGDLILKYYGVVPWLYKDNVLEKTIDDYQRLMDMKIFESCMINTNHAQIVVKYYENVLQLEAEINKKMAKYSTLQRCSVMPYLRVILKYVGDVVNRIPPHLKGSSKKRFKPYWLYIFGEPRVGKSSIFQPVIINALVQRLGIITEYQDPHNYSYYRNIGDKYWEKYCGQPVVQVNDAFQNYKDEEMMNTAVVELTNVVDDNPYPLNMANLEDKGGVYFTSKLLVVNAQRDIVGQSFMENLCWSEGEHIYARRNLVVELKLNDKYRDASGTGVNWTKVKTSNVQKCKYVDMYPNDLWNLVFYDKMKGTIIYNDTFDNGCDRILDDAENYFNMMSEARETLNQSLIKIWSNNQHRNVDHLNLKTLGNWRPQMNDEELQRELASIPKDKPLDAIPKDTPSERDMPRLTDVELHELGKNTFENLLKASQGDEAATRRFGEAANELIDNVWNKRPDHIRRKQRGNKMVSNSPVYSKTLKRGALVNVMRDSDGDIFYDAQKCVCHNMMFDYCKHKLNVEIGIDTPDLMILLTQTIANYHMTITETHRYHNYCIREGDKEKVYEDFMKVAAPHIVIHHQRRFIEKVRSAVNVFRNLIRSVVLGAAIYLIVVSIASIFRFLIDFFKSDKMETQSHEGDRKPKKVKKLRKQRHVTINKSKMNTQLYDQQNFDIENVIKHHFVTLKLFVQTSSDCIDIDVQFNAFCVGGSIFCMPRHYWNRINQYKQIYDKYNEQLLFKLVWNSKMEQFVNYDNIDVYLPEQVHTADLAFIRIKRLMAMRDLRRFFVRDDDDVNYYGSYLYGLRSSLISKLTSFDTAVIPVSRVKMDGIEYQGTNSVDKIHGNRVEGQLYVLPLAYLYQDCSSVRGDCGMLLMNTDSRSCRRIMGMHVAGDDNGSGCSVPIFVEDIDEAIEYFNSELPVVMLEDNPKHVTTQMNDSKMAANVEALGARIVGNAGYVEVDGKVKKIRATIPRKSKIQESVVYDAMEQDFGKCKFAPARLAPYLDEKGETVSPFLKAFKKLIKCSNMVSEKEYEIIVDHMKNSVLDWTSPYTTGEIDPRVLDDFETVNGCEGLKQIDVKTSAGCPYVTINNANGKLPWFDTHIEENGKVNYTMKGLCLERFKERIEKAKQGIVMENIAIDTLKDEVRLLNKVKEGKTRMFEMHSMDLNLAIRKYFGHFIAHCTLAKDSEVSVGINCNSLEWHFMVLSLRRVGELLDALLNGDFSDYDASLLLQWIYSMADCANAFYGGTEEENLIRVVLLISVVCRYDLIEDFLIMVMQGNTSGNALTALINCFVNMFMSRLCYIRLISKDLANYLRDIVAKYYGDDNLKAVSKRIKDKYNMHTISKILESLGMKYTSADKESDMKEIYTIQECSYLKRSFVYDTNYRIWKGQLDIDVIMTIPMFSESDPTNMRDQMNRFSSALLEMSNYGRKKFNWLRGYFIKYVQMLQKRGFEIKVTDLPTFDSIFECMYPSLAQKNWLHKHLEDLADDDGDALKALLLSGPDCDVGKLISYIPDNCTKPGDEIICTAQMNDTESNLLLTEEEVDIVSRRCIRGSTQCFRAMKPTIRLVRKEVANILYHFGFTPRNITRLMNDLKDTFAKIEAEDDEETKLVTQMNDGEKCMITTINEEQAEEYGLIEIDYDQWAIEFLKDMPMEHLVEVKKRFSEMITAMNVITKHESIVAFFEKFGLPYHLKKILAIKRHVNVIYTERAQCGTGDSTVDEMISKLSSRQRFDLFRKLVMEYGLEKSPPENTMTTQMNDQKTTVFIDDGEIQTEAIPGGSSTYSAPVEEESLTGFMNRPLIVNRYNWAASKKHGDSLALMYFPEILFTNFNSTEINNKISGFHMIKPDIEIEFRLTSTKQHYGTLLVVIRPLARLLNKTYTMNFANASSFEWHKIPACGNITYKIRIPYRHFLEAIDMRADADIVPKNLFSAEIYVLNPLTAVQGSASNIIGTVYASFAEPRLGGYTMGTGKWKSQMNDGEAEQKSERGLVVSDVVSDIGDFITHFEAVPMLGDYAKPIGKAVMRSAKLLRKYGYSTPINLSNTQPVMFRSYLYGKCEDNPCSIPLGPSMAMSVSKDFDLVNGHPSEMELLTYAQRPFLIHSGKITSATTVGTELWSLSLTPMNQIYTGESKGISDTMLDTGFGGGPLFAITRMFEAWRGGLRFLIYFDCSDGFHSFGVRCYWDPRTPCKDLAIESDGYSQNFVNETIMVDRSMDWCFTVPMGQDLDCLDVSDHSDKTSKGACNGKIYLQLVNNLTSSAATVNPVYFNVFMSAASDFEWFMPNTSNIPSRGMFVTQMNDAAESSESENEHEASLCIECNKWIIEVYERIGSVARDMAFKDYMDGDMDLARKHLQQAKICYQLMLSKMPEGTYKNRWYAQSGDSQQKVSIYSYKQATEFNYPMIGKTLQTGHRTGSKYYGYSVRNFKQLANMLTVLTRKPGTRTDFTPSTDIAGSGYQEMDLNPGSYYTFHDWAATVAEGTKMNSKYSDANYRENMLLNIFPLFLFWRGGFRIVIDFERSETNNTLGTQNLTWHTMGRVDNRLYISFQPNVGASSANAVVNFPIKADTLEVDKSFIPHLMKTSGNGEYGGDCGFLITQNVADFIVPYFSLHRCHVNPFGMLIDYNSSLTTNVIFEAFSLKHLPAAGLTSRKGVIYMAAGDDMIFGVQLGVPLMKRYVASNPHRDKRSAEAPDWLTGLELDWQNLDATMYKKEPPKGKSKQNEGLWKELNRRKDPEERKTFLIGVKEETEIAMRKRNNSWDRSRSVSPQPQRSSDHRTTMKTQMNDELILYCNKREIKKEKYPEIEVVKTNIRPNWIKTKIYDKTKEMDDRLTYAIIDNVQFRDTPDGTYMDVVDVATELNFMYMHEQDFNQPINLACSSEMEECKLVMDFGMIALAFELREQIMNHFQTVEEGAIDVDSLDPSME